MSGNTKQILTGRLGAANGTLVGRLGVGTRVEIPTTYVLVDENGNELVALLTDEEVKLTASEKTDIRAGTTAITDKGIVTGEKEIPAYYLTEGVRKISAGSTFMVTIRDGGYEYTKLQALFCVFNRTLSASVQTDRVAIATKVYPVNSSEAISNVTIDPKNEAIAFGIINNSDIPYVIRYFTYKEEQ